jgi:glycosyltransferase involved in cell wall biosynthesis
VATDLAARGFDTNRIRVVPDTSGLSYHPEHLVASIARIRDTGELRVLYVAKDRPYKNIGFAIRLAKELESTASPVRFRVTLLSRLRPETRRELLRANIRSLQVVPSAPSMEEVYQEHDVLVHPSLYEGFGRPVLEAMSFGMPVVVNQIPPLVEIVGDAGILLGVGATAAWSEALVSLTNLSAYERWGGKVLQQSRAFSPEYFRSAVRQAFDGLI